MDSQYNKFQKTLLEEVEQIERSFVEERTELLETNAKELNQLFEQRKANEAYFVY
jgi:dynein regulatory complex protein 1